MYSSSLHLTRVEDFFLKPKFYSYSTSFIYVPLISITDNFRNICTLASRVLGPRAVLQTTADLNSTNNLLFALFVCVLSVCSSSHGDRLCIYRTYVNTVTHLQYRSRAQEGGVALK